MKEAIKKFLYYAIPLLACVIIFLLVTFINTMTINSTGFFAMFITCMIVFGVWKSRDLIRMLFGVEDAVKKDDKNKKKRDFNAP